MVIEHKLCNKKVSQALKTNKSSNHYGISKKYLSVAPISSSASRRLGAAYVPILLSELEQEQRPSGNGDREAIVLGAGLCDGEGERAYTVYDPILGEEKYLIKRDFKRFAGAKTGYGTICRKTICRNPICRT